MEYRYAKEIGSENTAMAVGRSLPISTKASVEICRFIRNRGLQEAKDILQRVIDKKQAVPFLRYKKGVGHRKKIGPGRYPKKASMGILGLLKSVEANAQVKGLSTNNLVINHICCHKASRPFRYGRKRNVKVKRSHIEIIVEEKKDRKVEEKEKGEKKEETPEKKEKITEKEEKKKEVKKEIEEKEEPKKKLEKKEEKEKKIEEKKEIKEKK